MMFSPDGRKKMEAPGFGLQITVRHIDLMAGQFSFSPAQLAAYRAAVLNEDSGAALVRAVDQVTGGGDYRLGDPELKRAPRGFDADHPRADLLRHTGLALFPLPLDLRLAATSDLVDQVFVRFQAMAPLWSWLMENVPPAS